MEAAFRDHLRRSRKTTCSLCKLEVVDATPSVYFEFDHVDLGRKTFNVGSAIMQLRPLEEIVSEIELCRLLCDMCHSIVTRVQQVTGAYNIPRDLLRANATLNQEVLNKVHSMSMVLLHSSGAADLEGGGVEDQVVAGDSTDNEESDTTDCDEHYRERSVDYCKTCGVLDVNTLRTALKCLDLSGIYRTWPSGELTKPVRHIAEKWISQLGPEKVSYLACDENPVLYLSRQVLVAEQLMLIHDCLQEVAESYRNNPLLPLKPPGTPGSSTVVEFTPSPFFLGAFEYLVRNKAWMAAAVKTCQGLIEGMLKDGTMEAKNYGAEMIVWLALDTLDLESYSENLCYTLDDDFPCGIVYHYLDTQGRAEGEWWIQPENWFRNY